jgi:hypothetical protein
MAQLDDSRTPIPTEWLAPDLKLIIQKMRYVDLENRAY